MTSINMASILSKANAYMGTPSGENKKNTVVRKAVLGQINLQQGKSTYTPEEAADKFIDVLKDSINSSGLSAGAIEAVSNIAHDNPSSLGGNIYTIRVYFSGEMSRPSLDPRSFPGGISDIVALFNNGVDHTMRPVHGTWHGKEMWSKTTIPGTHFIENAVNTFMASYASEYNVIGISVEGI